MVTAVCSSCNKKLMEYKKDDVKITIEKGDSYLHDFSLFMGIKIKNAPQMAIWIEDLEGNYLSTVYVTKKIATQSWMSSGGNRRKEALPHWCFSRGVQYEDGLYLPTKKKPLADGMTGATPKKDFSLKLTPKPLLRHFIVKIEVNHSTDFNEHYPKTAAEGDDNYSGGEMGSGQPAVVYAAEVKLDSGNKEFIAHLLGHSSPDGSNGNIMADISTLTTALHIIKRITVRVE